MEEHGGDARWRDWQPDLRGRLSAEQVVGASEKIAWQRRFWAYVQWVAFRQWRHVRLFAESLGVYLMGDIPFGVSRHSADVWAQPELFDLTWCAGAPPEPLFRDDPFTAAWGQNWGMPVYNWAEHERQDWQWWRTRVGRTAEIFHSFRIDHVLGFFRVYAFPWVPERNAEFLNLCESEAAELSGGRLPGFLPRPDYPVELGEQNLRDGRRYLEMILAFAPECQVVAEDLGLVPWYVRPALKELKIPGFAIPQFERREQDRSFKSGQELEELAVATWATHDHEPLALYYENLVAGAGGGDHASHKELAHLLRFLGLDDRDPSQTFTDELHKACIKVLLETKCCLAIISISDLLSTCQRFNVPGVACDSNWSERLAHPLSFYEHAGESRGKVAYLAETILASGRLSDKAALCRASTER